MLADYLFALIVPEQYKQELLPYIPTQLENKVHFIPHDGLDVWDWAGIVYEIVERIK